MGRLLALDVNAAICEQLQDQLVAEDIAFEPMSKREGLTLLDADPHSVEALVIGREVPDPVQTAQRAFAAKPQLPVVILTSSDRNHDLRAALQFAPLIGEHVRCVIIDELSLAVRAIEEIVAQARKLARYQTTVTALNSMLSAPAPARPATPAVELLGRIMQRAPIGVVVLNRRGIITALNACGGRLLGTDEVSALGTPLVGLFRASEASHWRAFLGQLDSAQGDAPETFVGSSTAAPHFDVTGAVLTGRDGAPGYVILLQDVTERTRLIESERHARREAESASRTKDEFLAMLGHELRNPLSPIVTALQLMRLRGGESRYSREYEVIERQVQHLVRLFDDLLDISRITRGQVHLEKQRCDVATIVAKAIEQAGPLLEQRAHRLKTSVPTSGLVVDADPTRLAQVVCNLLTNSARYTEEGGNITVTASRVDDDIEIRVKDDGTGIAPEVLPRIFESFVQGKRGIDRSQGGLGLGLAIVRNLVSLHRGTVTAVSSGLGQGAEFIIRLPAAGDAGVAVSGSSPMSVTTSPAASAPRRILVVDDNVDAAELLCASLEQCGYLVRVAHDAESALREARDFAPEVCVLDIGLPDMDGHELGRRLRADPTSADALFIALTGYGQASDHRRSRDAGFYAHLVKPVDLARLLAMIEHQVADKS